jgi:endonuclease/exonuclease/phosphatase family metal-dependent hydrolase
MQGVLQSSKPWIKAQGVLLHNSKNIQVNIVLLNNSLSDSYLVFEEGQTSFCFLPISSEIIASFSITELILSLKFSRYDNYIVALKLRDLQFLELLVSHFGKSSILFNSTPDRFVKENSAFLRKIRVPDGFKLPFLHQVEVGGSTGLYPIITSTAARDVWETGLREQNTQFYLREVPLRISFLTWNVASRDPSNDLIRDLSRIFRVPAASVDIIIIGFEEIDMSFKSVVTGSSSASDRWTEILTMAKNLVSDSTFDLIASESMGGVYCAALSRTGMFPPARNGHIRALKLGANGMLANKAAVVFNCSIGETSLVSITCHLAPHDQNWEQRNSQWHELVEDLTESADFIVIMGDLNYRIVRTYEQCIELVKQGRLDELFACDQLHSTQQVDNIIGRFREAPIRFNPTFKFDKNCDIYDTSAKHRVPSWTDRILIRTGDPRIRTGLEDTLAFETDTVRHFAKPGAPWFVTDSHSRMQKAEPNFPREPKCICYRIIPNSFSDHRPVNATYTFPVPVIVKDRLELLNEIIGVKFEEIKAYSVPALKITPTVLSSKDTDKGKFALENASMVWIVWKVTKMPHGATISATEGVLMIDEKTTVEIQYGGENVTDEILIEVKNGPPLTLKIVPE